MESATLEAPAVDEVDDTINVQAFLSIPRVGWNEHWGCVLDALRPWNIPVRRFYGAYWDQGVEAALEEAIDEGVDWAFALDYDSMFTRTDVGIMLRHFAENPHIDALAALQSRRGVVDTALAGIIGGGTMTLNGDPVQVDTAHFGLTLIRLEKLKEMPHPWFQAVPGSTGRWTDDDHIDSDVNFWHKWREFGNNIYVDTLASIGHLELCVTRFNVLTGKTDRVLVKDWNAERIREARG